jgi:hypothetical protein
VVVTVGCSFRGYQCCLGWRGHDGGGEVIGRVGSVLVILCY